MLWHLRGIGRNLERTGSQSSPITSLCVHGTETPCSAITNYMQHIIIIIIISRDRNVINKEAKKILKYKDLTIEIHRMWNAQTKVIPVITGATGTISKSFRKYVNNIPRKHEVKELHKTAILGAAHILRKVLI